MRGKVDVSLIASACRPKIWVPLFKSLEGTSVEWEVVFAGPTSYADIPVELIPLITNGKFRYIETANIKPAQCYEVARRAAVGETIVWMADDCEFEGDVIGKAHKYWKSKENEKLILSIQTKESGYLSDESVLYDMNEHRFYGGFDKNAPLMAPLCLMSRKFLNDLGGIDRRFICGQYENFGVMMAYERGAIVEIFGDKDCCINIDHWKKSREMGESVSKEDFLNRPFSKGYTLDRIVLEECWTKLDPVKMFLRLEAGERPPTFRECVPNLIGEFHPYIDDGTLLTKSQGNNLPEMWC